ncbi:alpha/beta fold hydrolase BchO [Sphingorhabdus sp.]|uniref:alpha/beta fold hydrolase BchO n=1 Tax=Sphingorhabdus sp. TaxID=1902408 RepID=UPI003982FE8F
MSGRYPDWASDGKDWPNRESSSFVRAGGYHWHVQHMGLGAADAPLCLLIHGTGAATHSWRALMPLLAKQYRVVAMDLPGHGFTKSGVTGNVTLAGMAASLAALLDEQGCTPDLIVGHSAGVAIAAQLMLDKRWSVPLVGFAPALMPFPGLAARIFPSLAIMLFTNPFVSIIFSRMAQAPGQTAKFLARSTGSKIDAEGAKFYTRLFSKSGHCDGAIRMMANWRLEALGARLGEVTSPVLLIHPSKDAAIPKSAVTDAARLLPNCEVLDMQGFGHLAHEEDPEQAKEIVTVFAKAKLKP